MHYHLSDEFSGQAVSWRFTQAQRSYPDNATAATAEVPPEYDVLVVLKKTASRTIRRSIAILCFVGHKSTLRQARCPLCQLRKIRTSAALPKTLSTALHLADDEPLRAERRRTSSTRTRCKACAGMD